MSSTTERLRERWERTRLVMGAPRIRVELFGDDEAKSFYTTFSAPHPRFRFTQAKRWGVALLDLPRSFDEYLAGGSREYVRRQRRRAEKAGFHYAIVSPLDHLDDILAINRSAPTRQGRPMREAYLDRERVRDSFIDRPEVHGVLDADGRLWAYAATDRMGDAYLVGILLGHADVLAQGAMYYLISEVVRWCIGSRAADGTPHWLMYDTFWGASKGLAYFKERMGFRPYTVEWVWVEPGPIGSAV